jgi:hypothetical protein
MVSLLRVIQNWERSGQGVGVKNSVDEESDDEIVFGSLQNRSSGALDQRYSFVECSQMYLPYWWHMLDKHNLLGLSLQRLDDSVAASNGGEGVLSVIHCTTEIENTPTVFGTLDDSLNAAGVIQQNLIGSALRSKKWLTWMPLSNNAIKMQTVLTQAVPFYKTL